LQREVDEIEGEGEDLREITEVKTSGGDRTKTALGIARGF
jgi:hypothetical protein